MKKPDTERMSLRIEALWQQAEERIMQDIVRRIRQYNKITSTADYQINRLIELGKSSEEVERILKETLNVTYPKMYELYDEVANWQYVRNKDVYEQVNGKFVPPEENEWLTQASEAIKKQTSDELENLARSYGFTVPMNGKKVFTPFAQYYQQYVDHAIMDIVSGGFDYNTVIRRVVTQMTNSGLRTVPYASGYSNRTPVAARRAILTGISQITRHVNEKNAEILGTDYFEVDWHGGARPSHRLWQGKVYSRKELETVCGLGTGNGLCGWNCYHVYYAFIPGVSERLYTDEWLEEQNRKEAETKEWHGKEYDAYERTQKQRQMETAMRAQREKVALLKEAKADPDEIMLARCKYQAQLNEYSIFCKKMNLPEQRERIYYDMRGFIASNNKKQNAKYSAEMIRNADRDSKQYYRYKNIIGDSIGTLADFRQMKYNDLKKFGLLKKKVDTYSGIDKKDWAHEFKQKSKEAYDRLSKEDIYLSVHALSRLPRLNKKGFAEISEKELIKLLKGNPIYAENDKLVFFDEALQLACFQNSDSKDIVSIVRRKKPKEEWKKCSMK